MIVSVQIKNASTILVLMQIKSKLKLKMRTIFAATDQKSQRLQSRFLWLLRLGS